jgi:hypothetical protein
MLAQWTFSGSGLIILKVFTPVRRSRRGGMAKVEEYAPGVSGMSEGPPALEDIKLEILYSKYSVQVWQYDCCENDEETTGFMVSGTLTKIPFEIETN